MSEQPSVLPFPRWLLVLDVVAALSIAAGLLLRVQPGRAASLGLPSGTDIFLLALGGLGIVGCGVQIARYVIASKSSR